MGRLGYLRDELGWIVPWFRRGRNRVVAGIALLVLATALPWVKATVSGRTVAKGSVEDLGVVVWTVLAALYVLGAARDWDAVAGAAAVVVGLAAVGLFVLYLQVPGFGYPLVPGFDTPPEDVRVASGLYVLLVGGLVVLSGGLEVLLAGRR